MCSDCRSINVTPDDSPYYDEHGRFVSTSEQRHAARAAEDGYWRQQDAALDAAEAEYARRKGWVS